MNKSLSFSIGGLFAIAALALLSSFLFYPHQEAHANIYTATAISTATTSTAVSVTASTRVLATTTNANGNGASYSRVYATICNPSSTVVYLNLNADKPVTATAATAMIAAAAGYNVCYEITDRNEYSGSIQASSTVGAVPIFVTDYVQ